MYRFAIFLTMLSMVGCRSLERAIPERTTWTDLLDGAGEDLEFIEEAEPQQLANEPEVYLPFCYMGDIDQNGSYYTPNDALNLLLMIDGIEPVTVASVLDCECTPCNPWISANLDFGNNVLILCQCGVHAVFHVDRVASINVLDYAIFQRNMH